MTSEQQPISAGSPARHESIPADVADVARQRELGSLLSSRALPNPIVNAAVWLGVSVASFLVTYAIAASAEHMDPFGFLYSIVHAAVFAFFLLAVTGFIYTVRHLIIGPRSYWVFEDGFVYKQRRTIRALGWTEVERLSPVIGSKGDSAGKILRYNVVPETGRPIAVPLKIEKDRDTFMDALMGALQRHGKPIS